MSDYQIMIGADNGPVFVPAAYLNRHGLIAGATGTGKSVSAVSLAESLSRIGVPVFITDVKGDLSGMAAPSDVAACADIPGWRPESAPVQFMDVFRERGAPVTTTVRAMGAPLLARAMGLTDVQSGVIEIIFAVADDYQIPIETLGDLRFALQVCTDDDQAYVTPCGDLTAAIVKRNYGLITPASVAAIGRAILRLERAGAAMFFSTAPFSVTDLLQHTPDGRGVVSMLDCVRLIREPRLYAAVLMALLDALARVLPEVGDTDRPRLVLILDEAHLIFDDAPAELLRLLDQTVRLIRSKGVGIFFATQAPGDLPDSISRQLHMRVQHALRAVTPADTRAVYAAAQSMPAGIGFKAADVIGALPRGSALISYMDNAGKLTPARVIAVALPRCRLRPLSDTERQPLIPPAVSEAPRARNTVRAVDPAADSYGRAMQSDVLHGYLYYVIALLGLMACIPWATIAGALSAVLPSFFAYVLYPAPFFGALFIIAGIAKARSHRS